MNSGLIQIDSNTRISALLKAKPEVIEALVSINPHFSKLRNPVLRKLLAGRVNISDACRIAGCQVSSFMTKMEELGFVISEKEATANRRDCSIVEPETFKDSEVLEIDVRPILRSGGDPLKLILGKSASLKEGESFKLINSFEPVPLIAVLGRKGFSHYTEHAEPDLYLTWFLLNVREAPGDMAVKSDQSEQAADRMVSDDSESDFNAAVEQYGDKLVRLDVRELPMPAPMLAILTELDTLPPGNALLVKHKKLPVYLLPELEERGFSYLTQATEDDMLDLIIFRK